MAIKKLYFKECEYYEKLTYDNQVSRKVEGFSLTPTKQQLQHRGEQPRSRVLIGQRSERGRAQHLMRRSYWLKSVSVVSDLSGNAGNELKSLKDYDKLLKKRASLFTVVCARCFI